MERVRPSSLLEKINILYVEDEDNIRETFVKMLSKYVKNIFVASNGKEGIDIFNSHSIDMVISDIKMPEVSGIDLASTVKQRNMDIPVILITAFNDVDYLSSAIEIGVDGYLLKPIDRNRLFAKLNFLAEAVLSKKELASYIRLIEILFNYQANGLLLLDSNFKIKMYNLSFMEICENMGLMNIRSIDDLSLYCESEEGTKINKDFIVHLAKCGNSVIVKSRNDTNLKFYELEVKKLDDYYLISINDVTDLRLEVETIKEELMIDPLTKVFNRKKYEFLRKSKVGENVCVVLLDIDDFKKINDTYGHMKGDEVLIILADTIKKSLRESDVIIRWGGEEFLIVLSGVSKHDLGFKIAEYIRKSVSALEIEEVGHFTCSFGVSCSYISSENDFDELIEQADLALYKAKEKGKNRVEIYNPDIKGITS